MIAALVKEGRMAKGYTQKELSELSNISIRSIQRIENGEILPRNYTIKTLAGVLDQPFEQFAKILNAQPSREEQVSEAGTEKSPLLSINKSQRIILSAGICLTIVFLAWAFIAQSPRFPKQPLNCLFFQRYSFSWLRVPCFYYGRISSILFKSFTWLVLLFNWPFPG